MRLQGDYDIELNEKTSVLMKIKKLDCWEKCLGNYGKISVQQAWTSLF